MTYQEAVRRINSLLVFGSKPGLERIRELVDRIGAPDKSLKFIHVAGTNGKGSVCAMLSSVLQESGLKTGLFISPYVLEFRERFQINGKMIPEDELADIVERIYPVVESMNQEGKIITEFEMVFAVALKWYEREGCDVVVLETGLGGRFDATNIISTPLASVIMSISLDHTAILGDTLEKIAFEKCGIIKPEGITVLYGDQSVEVIEVVKEAAKTRNNELIVADTGCVRKHASSLSGSLFSFCSAGFDSGRETELSIPLLGEHQLYNADAVLHTVIALRKRGLNIPTEAVRRGLAGAFFPARLEYFRHEPDILLDGAHNPGGAAALRRAVTELLPDRNRTAVVGMLADKDVRRVLELMVPLFKKIVTVTPDNPRAMKNTELAELISSMGGCAEAALHYDDALKRAIDEASSNGAVVVFGSLYMASDMRRVILSELKDD